MSGLTDEERSAIAKLIERSEMRVDRTNEMICKLVRVTEANLQMLNKIVEEYTRQIGHLQQSRDELVQQNSILLKIIEHFAPSVPPNSTTVNIKKSE